MEIRMERCLNLRQTAEYLGVSERHVYYLVDMGSIEAWKVGKLWRFFRGAVDQYAGGKYHRRTYKNSARHSDRGRGGNLFELFYGNNYTADKKRKTLRLPGKRRIQPMEHQPSGHAQIPGGKHKHLGKSRNILPLQLEFDFGIVI
jgi:excisionase family DNA binding protein